MIYDQSFHLKQERKKGKRKYCVRKQRARKKKVRKKKQRLRPGSNSTVSGEQETEGKLSEVRSERARKCSSLAPPRHALALGREGGHQGKGSRAEGRLRKESVQLMYATYGVLCTE